MNRYNEIIELEPLDELIGWDDKFVIRVLLILIERLKVVQGFSLKYRFEVISYGFQGYYPVIGVEYLSNHSDPVEELVGLEFEKLSSDISLKELLEFDHLNKDQILRILEKLNKDNSMKDQL